MQKIGYAGYRFPPEIIEQAIWLYLRFTLSFRDVEDLLAERGYGLVRDRSPLGESFGPMIAADLRKRRPKPYSIWHLDEVYLKIAGRMVYLWRAVDAEGEVLDVLVQSKRDKHAAMKLMRKLLKKYGFIPDRMITDDLRSYGAAARDLGIESRHERGQWRNNRAETPSAHPQKGAQDAAFQEPRFSTKVPFHPRRRLQHFQRPASSNDTTDLPSLPRCGDERMARGRRGCIRSRGTMVFRVLDPTS